MSSKALLSIFLSYYSPQSLWPYFLSLFSTPDLDLSDALNQIDRFHDRIGLPKDVFEKLKQSLNLERDFEELDRKGISVLSPGDPLYPQGFYDLNQPPLGLMIFGHMRVPKKSVSIVGSREFSISTHQWMLRHLYPVLQNESVSVCSGGARGVDDAAMRIALNAKQSAYVFLPSGFGLPYPQTLDLKRHADEGAIFLTEFPYFCAMKKHHFQRRNRLIAAFSDTLFVAECRAKSGSMVTARWAIDLHRTVSTLPAFPDQVAFSGNLQLLFEGAHIVRDKEDLKQLLNLSPNFFKAQYR